MTLLQRLQLGFLTGNFKLSFTFSQPFAAKRDGSETTRVHVTKDGRVTYRPYPMSISRSVVGLSVINNTTTTAKAAA